MNYKISTTSKPSIFAQVVRFMTNRSVCLIFLLIVCTLSLLVSITQFEINKQITIRSSPMLDSSVRLQDRTQDVIYKKIPSQKLPRNSIRSHEKSYQLNLKLTSVTISSTFEFAKNASELINNKTREAMPLLKINNQKTEILEESENELAPINEKQQQHLVLSSEQEFAKAAERLSNGKFLFRKEITLMDRSNIGKWIARSSCSIGQRSILGPANS